MENEEEIFNNELKAIEEFYNGKLHYPIGEYFRIKDGQLFFDGEKGLDEVVRQKIVFAYSRAYRR